MNARSITLAAALSSYLLRAMWRRVDWNGFQRDRRMNLRQELENAIVPHAVAERSTLAWFRALSRRFDVSPSGAAFESPSGESHMARALYALVPRRFLPADVVESPHEKADAETACVRWDVLCQAIDFDSLRAALHESPQRIATFATSEPVVGEELTFPLEDDAAVPRYVATLPQRLHAPQAYRTVMTALSPVAHGGDEKHGNVTVFRRERMVDPVSGDQHLRPFISGNAVRGMWRDRVMDRMLSLLGVRAEDLPPATAHALFSGGVVEAGADGSAVNVGARRRARAMCPAWDLLAGCIDKQIMRGLLRVSDVWLVCRENAWFLRELLHPTDPVTGEALSYEAFVAALKPADDLTQLRLETKMAHRDFTPIEGAKAQMILNVEVILPGAQFVHQFSMYGIGGVSELAASCMADLLADWRDDAYLGAKNSHGMGQVAFDPYVPGDATAELPSPVIYQRWLRDNAEEIRGWLMRTAGGASEVTAGEADAAGGGEAASAKGKRGGKGKAKPAAAEA